eukprot:TRINITY_DN3035_c0_g1_i1.p1 TRINITY_DN3035_c0_g1~~TRINITY_DN3035_c0_g1_i1.p1  ORF type:complete len:113 (+),score=20.43 TRINITY_DN3035_c0_g1_i1:39-377(+)
MFEGLLDIVFQQLYCLPISKAIGGYGMVNKRWNKIWDHPLFTFMRGEFNRNVRNFPPSYYTMDRKERRLLKEVNLSRAIGKHLEAVLNEGDEDREGLCNERNVASFLYKKRL